MYGSRVKHLPDHHFVSFVSMVIRSMMADVRTFSSVTNHLDTVIRRPTHAVVTHYQSPDIFFFSTLIQIVIAIHFFHRGTWKFSAVGFRFIKIVLQFLTLLDLVEYLLIKFFRFNIVAILLVSIMIVDGGIS